MSILQSRGSMSSSSLPSMAAQRSAKSCTADSTASWDIDGQLFDAITVVHSGNTEAADGAAPTPQPRAPAAPSSGERPRRANLRRFRSTPASTAEPPSSGGERHVAKPFQENSLLSEEQVASVARERDWLLLWPDPGFEELPPVPQVPYHISAVLVGHTRGREAVTMRLAQKLRETAEVNVPIFVLLLDACGASTEEYDYVMATQQLMRGDVEDVVCNVRSPCELTLAVDMAIRRRDCFLEVMSSMRAQWKKDVEKAVAGMSSEVEKASAASLFWQSVDRLLRGFPAMDASLPAALAPKVRVGPCVLEAMLGQGIFSKVYSTLDEHTMQGEALKVIPKSGLAESRAVRALHKEMDLHRRLEHPHIVKLVGVLHGPKHIFLRLELASAGTLVTAMQGSGGVLPEERAKRLQGQLVDAVAYCHKKGVAHRDLKPENIGLEAAGSDIKVLDFGCCVPTTCRRIDIAGSFPFMAPEVYVASKVCPYAPAAVDAWACAMILLEMLCGAQCFQQLLGWDRRTLVAPQRYTELSQCFGDGSPVGGVLEKHLGRVEVDLEELLAGGFTVNAEQRWSARRMAESQWLAPVAEA